MEKSASGIEILFLFGVDEDEEVFVVAFHAVAFAGESFEFGGVAFEHVAGDW